MKPIYFTLSILVLFAALTGCKTKSDVLREQQMRRMQKDLHAVKTKRADGNIASQELQMEITRLSSLIELQSQQLDKLTLRLEKVEKLTRKRDARTAPIKSQQTKASYQLGQKLFKLGKYSEAMSVLKRVIKTSRPKSADARKAQFLLAESYYGNKAYALAALEYAQYKKNHPSDSLVPRAIYQQASSFRKMGKKREAKLFYQELIDRFPRHALVATAKREAKSMK